MELLPVPNEGNPNWPNWEFCDFKCYVPWFRMYNQVGEESPAFTCQSIA
jgi:hypothetical protein